MKKYKLMQIFPGYQKMNETYKTDALGLLKFPNSNVLFDPDDWPHYFKEIKEPVFITADGVEKYFNDSYYYTDCVDGSISVWDVDSDSNYTAKQNKFRFDNIENAEKFIEMNKKIFSKQDIIDTLSTVTKKCGFWSITDFKDILRLDTHKLDNFI